ncbi:YesK family protein [Paraliobacillus salinarum]|uniref:YesK family protein n=1 Tax=Paraliobacillus salinarum TaxID=1158996 RepID=UPI001FEAA829|nr:YesK family protein [Paraliobacillus salinarum]
MLEGWTPILLMGIIAAVIIFFISRKVSKKVLFFIAVILSIICFGIVIYSIIGVGGWDGMGIGFVTITVFIGIWIGAIIGAILKKRL